MNNEPVEAMSGVDRAWLEMDSPKNPMVVNAIIEFDGPVNAYTLCAEIVERMLRYPRFRQRADHGHSPPRWIDDAGLNLEYHSQVASLKNGQSAEAIRAALETQVNQALDLAMPLWRLLVFPRDDQGATVLFRAHHAMADGIALVELLMNCTDAKVRARASAAAPVVEQPHHHGPLGGLINRLETINRVAEKVGDFALSDLRHPEWIPGQLREARDMLSNMGHVLSLPDDNPPALHRPLSGHRSLAWASGISLAPIKALALAEKVKVNDIFLAAVSGAFTRYLSQHGENLRASQNLRVSVPVNLRPEDSDALGNCFGLILVDLPLGIRDWRERLPLVSQRMQEIKRSPAARTVLLALSAAGHMPVTLEKQLVNRVAGKSVAVVSNLRGPGQPMRLAGARIRDLIFWPPQAGAIGVGVSLFSYDRRVSIGISADDAVMAHPDEFVAAFKNELADMLAAVVGSAGARRGKKSKPFATAHGISSVPLV